MLVLLSFSSLKLFFHSVTNNDGHGTQILTTCAETSTNFNRGTVLKPHDRIPRGLIGGVLKPYPIWQNWG